MKPKKLILELEDLVEQAGYTIRKERGRFRGDHCIVEGDKMVVVNKNQPEEMQVGTYARVLDKLDLEDVYIKPAVRKELEKIWERIDQFEGKESEIGEQVNIDFD